MATSSAPVAGVIGMRALRRDLNKLAEDRASIMYQEIKRAGYAAASPVASAARAALPKVSSTLSGDVRVSGNRTGATVRMGRVSVPYAGWIEFGGVRGDGSERPYVSGGRYLFPAAESLASVAAGLYSDGLQRALDVTRWTNTTSSGSAVHD